MLVHLCKLVIILAALVNKIILTVGDVQEMREVPASDMRDTEWATQTCILGYNTLGKKNYTEQCLIPHLIFYHQVT